MFSNFILLYFILKFWSKSTKLMSQPSNGLWLALWQTVLWCHHVSSTLGTVPHLQLLARNCRAHQVWTRSFFLQPGLFEEQVWRFRTITSLYPLNSLISFLTHFFIPSFTYSMKYLSIFTVWQTQVLHPGLCAYKQMMSPVKNWARYAQVAMESQRSGTWWQWAWKTKKVGPDEASD